MGYVETAFAADGTEIDLLVRGKALPGARGTDAVRSAPLQTREPWSGDMSETRYTDQHEWARLDGDKRTIGITKHAAEQLGDVVFVELPGSGRTRQRRRAAVVESVKAASEVYAPISGTVTEATRRLSTIPPRSMPIRRAKAGSSS